MMLYALDDVRPEIDPSAWVAPTATVIGKVRLGSEASIWFGALLRGDNELLDIGARSNIQDGVAVHSDMGAPVTIGADCTIGHNAIIHGCIIEEGVLIGMGATILNGAVIGAGSLVGAGALVTEGKIFPPGSLIVGAPAKVKRSLSEAEQQKLRASAAGYVANAARFRKGLRLLSEG